MITAEQAREVTNEKHSHNEIVAELDKIQQKVLAAAQRGERCTEYTIVVQTLRDKIIDLLIYECNYNIRKLFSNRIEINW